jgi:hypothetical protein
MIVKAVRTILSPTQAIDAIWHAHQDIIGGPCPVPLLEILSAQSALETARWHSMWNDNFGNLRGHGDAGSMSIKGADEIIDGKRQTGEDVDAGFAAYSSAQEGARAFVRYLGVASHPPAPNRFQKAWDAACSGDVDTYINELHAHGYFTASPEVYRRAMHGDIAWLRAGPMPEFLRYLQPGQEPFPLEDK